MHSNFLRVGNFFVQEHHINSIQFNEANGSATVHAGSNAMTTSDPDDIGVLRELVEDRPHDILRPVPDDAQRQGAAAPAHDANGQIVSINPGQTGHTSEPTS